MKKKINIIKRKKFSYRILYIIIPILIIVPFLEAAVYDLQKLAKEFQKSAILDFVNFTIKGERYPLIHTISELRYRVFSIKMGINSRDETRVCSNKRNFGIAVPKDQIDFCMEYDYYP